MTKVLQRLKAMVLALWRGLFGGSRIRWPENAPGFPTLSPQLEEALPRVDWSRRDVLVGSLGSEAQLESNLQWNYYHVPACYLSDDGSSVRYVAIYQSRNLFGEGGGIRYYGEVTHVERMERRKVRLPVNRHNDGEIYCVFHIRQWKLLPRTVAIREEWVSEPRFTNFFLLEHAKQSYELFSIRSEQDFRLMALLHGLLEGSRRSTACKVRRDRGLLLTRGSIAVITPEGKLLDQISLNEFREAPGSGFWRIKRAIQSS